MICNYTEYDRPCACGKHHRVETRFAVIQPGVLREVLDYCRREGLTGTAVAVYDRNTYAATAGRHPAADREIVLDPQGLHADERGVQMLMEQLTDDVGYLLAIGSGTVHDITRYCAYKKGVPFVSCPTAASVDGFCSSVAAMTWGGCKKTLTAVAPRFVLADTDIIRQAPMRLTRSGYGDMIGKYVALADWRIAHTITGEYLCETIAALTMDATKTVLDSAAGIRDGQAAAYESLIQGLLLSGIAMQLLSYSRPASGAEHHISHLIETEPPGLGIHTTALHGEKVGIGTRMVSAVYHQLADGTVREFRDYVAPDKAVIERLFGEKLAPGIYEENREDVAQGITGEQLAHCWPALRQIIATIPTPAALDSAYATIGAVSRLSEIGIDEEKAPELLRYAPLVRHRLTLLRLLPCFVME